MITKEQFNEIWKDSSRESILNQFYYEHIELLKMLEENENLKSGRQAMAKDLHNRKEKIDKAIDKLYCYGEVFDSKILQQFQKEMLNILEGSDKE